jgi:exonuclease SbcD
VLKILHTADWHIGKNLHKVPMQDQFILFFDWLLETIKNEDINVLLVSGDIFDYANPAAEDRRMYYSFLKRLVESETTIIITGGNHDSAGFLNAPKEILSELDIKVVGEATEDIEDEIIEIKNSKGEVELVVAAVPFLKDKDLRNRMLEAKFENRTEAIKEGIRKHYEELGQIIKTKYTGTPCIAMGHLYAVGSDPSESERDIHMGNQAAVGGHVFLDNFNYVALGHIHRPQIIGNNEFIRYSGSPVPLSFSEKKDQKSVVILSVDKGQILSPKVLPVPKTRNLLRIKGSIDEVSTKLKDLKNEYKLPTFVELVVTEQIFSALTIEQFEALKSLYEDHEEFVIIKSRIEFEQGAKDISSLFHESKGIQELKPMDVFMRKLEAEELSEENSNLLKEAFLELLEMVENED